MSAKAEGECKGAGNVDVKEQTGGISGRCETKGECTFKCVPDQPCKCGAKKIDANGVECFECKEAPSACLDGNENDCATKFKNLDRQASELGLDNERGQRVSESADCYRVHGILLAKQRVECEGKPEVSACRQAETDVAVHRERPYEKYDGGRPFPSSYKPAFTPRKNDTCVSVAVGGAGF